MINNENNYILFCKRLSTDVLEGIGSKNYSGGKIPDPHFPATFLSKRTISPHTFSPIRAYKRHMNASSLLTELLHLCSQSSSDFYEFDYVSRVFLCCPRSFLLDYTHVQGPRPIFRQMQILHPRKFSRNGPA